MTYWGAVGESAIPGACLECGSSVPDWRHFRGCSRTTTDQGPSAADSGALISDRRQGAARTVSPVVDHHSERTAPLKAAEAERELLSELARAAGCRWWKDDPICDEHGEDWPCKGDALLPLVETRAQAALEAEARGRVELAAKIERVEALVGDFVHLSRTLHSVVQAEAYADAAADLRRALAAEVMHRYDPDTCRCICGALGHPEWGVTA